MRGMCAPDVRVNPRLPGGRAALSKMFININCSLIRRPTKGRTRGDREFLGSPKTHFPYRVCFRDILLKQVSHGANR